MLFDVARLAAVAGPYTPKSFPLIPTVCMLFDVARAAAMAGAFSPNLAQNITVFSVCDVAAIFTTNSNVSGSKFKAETLSTSSVCIAL